MSTLRQHGDVRRAPGDGATSQEISASENLGDIAPDLLNAIIAIRLRRRLGEIADAAFARIRERSSTQLEMMDSEYVLGLRASITAALEWGLDGIESALDPRRSIPTVLIEQARRAARAAIGIETIQQRYLAGAEVFAEFLRAEVSEVPIGRLDRTLRTHEEQLEHVLGIVARAHAEELLLIDGSPDELVVGRIRRLLANEYVDLRDFDYDFSRLNLALIAMGRGAREIAQLAAQELGCRLLSARAEEDRVWAWLTTARQPRAQDLERALGKYAHADIRFAIGEWQSGLKGWRTSHWQAEVALQVGLITRASISRYGDSLVLATILRDDMALQSLRELYLEPLDKGPRSGAIVRETLRQYLACERNIASAAHSLGVHRHTVRRRVLEAERCLERTVTHCQTELALALELDRLGIFADPQASDQAQHEASRQVKTS